MASRRTLFSSALRASSAAVHPARPIFAVACRAARPVALRAAASAPHTLRPVRWYSVSNEDTVHGSRIWEFEELKNEVKNGDGSVVIVDVREPAELYETGKIPGAINIPITSAVQSFHIPDEDFEAMYGFDRPPKDAHLLFYCKAGVRARAAAGLAKHAGWDNVGEYPGSWLDWQAQNGPTEYVATPKNLKKQSWVR
ncbi:hypothetical protein FDECE_7958 [Fusarium decemcellulare]|nr:hypothetical protein FDECE_7958 [Fusarium decemcellulare]